MLFYSLVIKIWGDLQPRVLQNWLSFVLVSGQFNMKTVAQTFHDEIEVERLWAATKQGEFILFSVLPLTIVFIYLLWEEASHPLLLSWFAIINVINFIR